MVFVEVLENATGKIVKRLGPMPVRKAERIESGMDANLDHENYHVRIREQSPNDVAAYKLLSYVLTVSEHNTSEWMDGLVEEINSFAAVVGEEDRAERYKDGLRIVKPDVSNTQEQR